MTPTPRIEKLSRNHSLEGFDCGQEDLNRFLIQFALQNQQAEASQTYVALSGSDVAGYYTLVVGEIAYDEAPERLRKGLARHPVPLMLLARLAIGLPWRGQGMGSGLLKDAMKRAIAAADIAGIRAFAVYAKDEHAIAFYRRFDFVPSPSDPNHLFRMMKDIRAQAKAESLKG